MTAFNPTLAAAIVAKRIPLSADYAPQPATPRWHQLRTDLIRTVSPYMPTTAVTEAVDKLDELIRKLGAPGLSGDVEFGVAAVQPGEDFETFFVCDSRAAAEKQIADYGDVYRSCRLVQRDGRYGAWTEAGR